MGKFIDMTGQQFGRLSVVKRAESTKNGVKWECLCSCGKTTIVYGASLRSQRTKSCGCYHADIVSKTAKQVGLANRKHGMSHHRLHHIWAGMKQRCQDKADADYGGRGITVCDEWRDSFEAFCDWALANGYRDDLTIERNDTDGDYCPENCRWATPKEQANNKRNSRLIEWEGRTKTLQQWADETGISCGTIAARLRSGWSVERTLTEPIHTENRKKEN